MRFLMMITSDESRRLDAPPQALMDAIAELGEQATKDGTMLENGGLLPTYVSGARVRVADGKVSVFDGPFTEAKEVVGGYAMYQLRSREEAIEAGRRFMQVHADIWPEFTATCEIRQVFDPADFEADALRG